MKLKFLFLTTMLVVGSSTFESFGSFYEPGSGTQNSDSIENLKQRISEITGSLKQLPPENQRLVADIFQVCQKGEITEDETSQFRSQLKDLAPPPPKKCNDLIQAINDACLDENTAKETEANFQSQLAKLPPSERQQFARFAQSVLNQSDENAETEELSEEEAKERNKDLRFKSQLTKLLAVIDTLPENSDKTTDDWRNISEILTNIGIHFVQSYDYNSYNILSALILYYPNIYQEIDEYINEMDINTIPSEKLPTTFLFLYVQNNHEKLFQVIQRFSDQQISELEYAPGRGIVYYLAECGNLETILHVMSRRLDLNWEVLLPTIDTMFSCLKGIPTLRKSCLNDDTQWQNFCDVIKILEFKLQNQNKFEQILKRVLGETQEFEGTQESEETQKIETVCKQILSQPNYQLKTEQGINQRFLLGLEERIFGERFFDIHAIAPNPLKKFLLGKKYDDKANDVKTNKEIEKSKRLCRFADFFPGKLFSISQSACVLHMLSSIFLKHVCFPSLILLLQKNLAPFGNFFQKFVAKDEYVLEDFLYRLETSAILLTYAKIPIFWAFKRYLGTYFPVLTEISLLCTFQLIQKKHSLISVFDILQLIFSADILLNHVLPRTDQIEYAWQFRRFFWI